MSSGQIVYIRIKQTDPLYTVSWSAPSDGMLYWENDTPPTQTSEMDRSTLYKIIKIHTDGIYLGTSWGDYHV
jgi:hypothetical protein